MKHELYSTKYGSFDSGSAWMFWIVPAPALALALLRVLGVMPRSFDWVRMDVLGAVFLFFIAVLGTAVFRFADRQMRQDPQRDRFLLRLMGTLWAVQGMAVSGHLLLFFGFWLLTSGGLHRLLEHFASRETARAVAWEKFLVSRIGDLALGGALLLLQWKFKTLHLTEIEAALNAGGTTGPWIPLLLALGAAAKSAQVPFHAWLPRTLEAPTPVSALLHAGIINAGGFLLVRTWPILQHSESALLAVTIFGLLSALWGGLALLVQTDVKRRLAWSTVGQMGFMMIEIGLGAPALALVHLMGHGLYKAHAFLWSGSPSIAAAPPRPDVNAPSRRIFGVCLWGLLGVVLVTLGSKVAENFTLSLVVWAALLPLVASGWTRWHQAGPSTLLGTLVMAAGPWLALGAGLALGLSGASPEIGSLRFIAGLTAAVLVAGAGLIAAFPDLFARWSWYRHGYAAALHGFAFGRWPDEVIWGLRPRRRENPQP